MFLALKLQHFYLFKILLTQRPTNQQSELGNRIQLQVNNIEKLLGF